MAPDGGAGADLDVALAAAIPARHGDALPGHGRVGQRLGQVCQELVFCSGPPVRAGQAWRRRIVKGNVHPQARDAGHPAAADDGQELQVSWSLVREPQATPDLGLALCSRIMRLPLWAKGLVTPSSSARPMMGSSF